MAFTAQDVKNLREKTGVGMMECKKALTEADGDMDKAFEILRERGLAASVKKASRIAAEGAIIAYTDEAAKTTVLLEINSETDFVVRMKNSRRSVLMLLRQLPHQNPQRLRNFWLLLSAVPTERLKKHFTTSFSLSAKTSKSAVLRLWKATL